MYGNDLLSGGIRHTRLARSMRRRWRPCSGEHWGMRKVPDGRSAARLSHAGLPDVDRGNSPWCRHSSRLGHSACGVTADLAARLRADAATPKTAHAWRGVGRIRVGDGGQASAQAMPDAPDRARDYNAPRPSARRHGRRTQMTVDRRSTGIRVGFAHDPRSTARRSRTDWSIGPADRCRVAT